MTWNTAQELFAAALPGYEQRKEQTRLAETIEEAMGHTERLMAQAGCGCIQGDAEIIVNRGGNGRRMTLRDLVVRFNGGRTPGQQRRWNLDIPTYVQREVDVVVRLGRVLHAWHSGVKITYTVTTDTGRTLRATDEHPFLTERGWLRLDELKVDDELHVRGEQGTGRPRQVKLDYRRLCVLPHPYRNQKTVPEHRLVAEADLNGLEFADYLSRVRAGDLDGLTFLDPEVYAVHHKDHDTSNNALSNLQVMTHAEHHALHAAEGKTNSVLYKIVTERVVSVELFGEEDTYDIEVADDPHNFLVNGIVVHNTGKSFAALVPAIDHALATGTVVLVATATKALQTQYCLAPETRVLTADLRYIRAGDVTEGMVLAGFDEERVGHRRRYRNAVVESADIIERPCYELTFDDGTVITASAEHKWLCKKSMGVKWMTTEQLCVAAGQREGSNVIRLFDTWETDKSYSAGYLAAAFDGEGHLSQFESPQLQNGVITKLAFAQRNNAMLDTTKKALDELGFPYCEGVRPDIHSIGISHRREIVRFLGQVRPARLLPKFDLDKLGTIDQREGVRLVAKRFVGTREVMAIGTSTKTLIAEGLASHNSTKDLPFLTAQYALAGRPFRFAVVKGRGSYLCQAKLDEVGEDEYPNLTALRAELDADPEHTGDLDDVATPIDVRTEKAKLTTGSEECPGKAECPFGEVCFAEAAKKRAAESQIVVANHSYAVVDAQIRTTIGTGLLPDYETIVVDEGHELIDYTTNAIGAEFNQRQMARLAGDAGRLLDEMDHPAVRALQAAAAVLFADALPELLGRKKTLALTNKMIVDHSEHLVALWQAVEDVHVAVVGLKIYGDDKKTNQRKRMMKRTQRVMESINAVTTASDDKLVRWVAQDTRMVRGERETTTVLKYAPLSVAEFLDTNLWNTPPVCNQFGEVVVPGHPRAVVVMSATLTTGGNDFSYIAHELGVDLDDYDGFDAGTPFDFATQAALYVPKARTSANPKGFADPSKDTDLWRTQAQQVTRRLVLASGGRALLLFTSRDAMDEAYEMLAEDFEAEGISVYMQGQKDMTNRQLADAFREEETSVLFALKSFMTGVDFQGRTLQLVIMDKLPFTPPDDIINSARNAAADREVAREYGIPVSEAKWHKRGSFNGRIISAAILVLMQALGRGVRTVDDHALLVVLDPRIARVGGKVYGKRIRAALPPARQLDDLPTALSYLATLDA